MSVYIGSKGTYDIFLKYILLNIEIYTTDKTVLVMSNKMNNGNRKALSEIIYNMKLGTHWASRK